jgi:predicted DNA binding CopG/RHH family protein
LNAIFEHAKKSKNINIRINEYDLESIKEQSSKEGLPYQTFISSVLHRYITHQLIDEDAVLKTLQILKHHS